MNSNALNFIPWMTPFFCGNEAKYVTSAVESTWISGGEFLTTLESAFSKYTGCEYAIAVANGTAALHLAFLAIGIQEGDEVIVPGFGFLAAANVLLHMKAIPVFVDIDEKTWCIDPTLIPEAISCKTRAVLAVHPLGNLCDMDSIRKICSKNNLVLIEDAAEGFPSRYHNKPAGSLADISTLSLQATKTITTGEGGMVLTNNYEYADTIDLYKSHGLRRVRHYWHEVPGLNYRLTNLQAALGCSQFENLDLIIEKRIKMYEIYIKCLSGLEGVTLQEITEGVDPVIWAVGIKLDANIFRLTRDALINEFKKCNVECRPGFYTPTSLGYFDVDVLKFSESVSMSSLLLPSWPGLSELQIQFICHTLASFITPLNHH